MQANSDTRVKKGEGAVAKELTPPRPPPGGGKVVASAHGQCPHKMPFKPGTGYPKPPLWVSARPPRAVQTAEITSIRGRGALW